MSPSRRTLLTAGLGGAVLLGLGGAGLALRPGAEVDVTPDLRVLTPRQYGILVAVADRICAGGDGRPAASAVGVAEKVDHQLSTMHPADAVELGQGLLLIENALVGLLLDGRTMPFTLLGPDAQDAVLEDFRTSRIAIRRSVYKALRGLVAASYWGDPRLYAAVGYPGPPDFRSMMRARAAEEAAAGAAVGEEVPG